MMRFLLLLLFAAPSVGLAQNLAYDVVLRGGTIYDGSGGAPFVGDVALAADTIAAVGALGAARGHTEIDVTGLAVAPGFINMLSWANRSLLLDGRSQGDIRQGVTLEVFGEGSSMGPLNEAMRRAELAEAVADLGSEEAVAHRLGIAYRPGVPLALPWTTLGEYLTFLERRGVSTNVASLVGATTLRVHEVGYDDRPATPAELDRMRDLVRQAMEEGALGVGSSLIYAPAAYASTDELVALSEVAAAYDGLYTTHMRSEGAGLLEAIDEVIEIARRAGIRAEIYHLKASGRDNWGKLDAAIAKIEAARAEGLAVTADIYTYPASSTGLNASLPLWVKDGGFGAEYRRLADPALRERVVREIDFRNGAENVLLIGFDNEALRPLIGRRLSEVAAERGVSPEEAAVDLILEDSSRVGVIYFSMSEENLRKKVRLPWVSFGSDGASMAPEGVFLENSTHPRAYGTFARLLGRFVRDEGLIPLEAAIHRLTAFPAATLNLDRRGHLRPGYFADLAIFDPDAIIDHATYEDPHRYATGMVHVFVNGEQVLRDGEHTAATPGRFVRGPGARRTH